jgi:hypothetical protein
LTLGKDLFSGSDCILAASTAVSTCRSPAAIAGLLAECFVGRSDSGALFWLVHESYIEITVY